MTAEFQPLIRLVDDDASFRESLRLFLCALNLPVQDWPDAQQFLHALDPERPGCIILDIRMPGMTGIECQRRLEDVADRIPVIFLTGHGDVSTAVHAMKAGAFDFIEKEGDPMALVETVERACERSINAFHALAADRMQQAKFDSLSAREKVVLRMAASGLSNKDMGDRLGVSAETVKMHRANAFGKIGVRSALEAYQWLENVPQPLVGIKAEAAADKADAKPGAASNAKPNAKPNGKSNAKGGGAS